MRRTKIVATIGPATSTEEALTEIIASGVDVLRLNAAHASPSEMSVLLETARTVSRRAGKEIGVLVDLAGPKVRIGAMREGTVLAEGSSFRFMVEDCVGDAAGACVNYDGLSNDLHHGDIVVVDDGRIRLEVESTRPGAVLTRVLSGGPLLSNKGVNVPGVTLSVANPTAYDLEVLRWAMGAEVDWIGQSFVRSAADVEALRCCMVERPLPVMAKIEKHEAAGRIAEIVSAADGVMVARGDLALETAPEQVPVLQRQIVEAARDLGRPVVIATEMLDSMRERSTPTRAEASDVANAIFSSVDAVMLSAETAVGRFSAEAVATMARIIDAAESEPAARRTPSFSAGLDDVQQAVSAAVCELANDLGLAAIITITQTGATASAVSRFRPHAPIVAATPDISTARRMAMGWGIGSIVLDFPEDMSALIDRSVSAARASGFVMPGDRVALTAGLSTRAVGGTDFIHVKMV